MGVVKIKWTDPPDISTNEPAPATWAGTVVVRKEGSAPRHRWDGTLIVDSTTRDEYSTDALVDDTVERGKTYYYGIFPYDTKDDYRYTKVVGIFIAPIIVPKITSLIVNLTAITVNYSAEDRYTYDYITLVYKKNSAPASKTDGTAVSLSASDTSKIINGLDENTTYYFKIFAQVTGASGELESNAENATTGEYPIITYNIINKLKLLDLSNAQIFTNLSGFNDPDINQNPSILNALQQKKIVILTTISQAQYSFDITDDILTFGIPAEGGRIRILLPFDKLENIVRISERVKFVTPTIDNRLYVFWDYMENGKINSYYACATENGAKDWNLYTYTYNQGISEYLSLFILHDSSSAGAASIQMKELFIDAKDMES